MKTQQVLSQIAYQLYQTSPVEDPAGEVGLLAAFCHLPSQYPTANLQLAYQVADGKLSLQEAYSQMADAFPDFYDCFEQSQVPSELSSSEIIKHLRAILALKKNNKDAWLKELVSLSVAQRGWLRLLPNEVVQLMVNLGLEGKRAESVYTPFGLSTQLAVEAASVADEVIYETISTSRYTAACVLLTDIIFHILSKNLQ